MDKIKGVGKAAEILLLPILSAQKFIFRTTCKVESVIDEEMEVDPLASGSAL